jgi:hypothetical protein
MLMDEYFEEIAAWLEYCQCNSRDEAEWFAGEIVAGRGDGKGRTTEGC